MLTLLLEICMGLIFGCQFLTVTNPESTVTIGKKVILNSTHYLLLRTSSPDRDTDTAATTRPAIQTGTLGP